VTSLFVATSEQNRDPYGLMSMADPVLRFRRIERDFPFPVKTDTEKTMLEDLLSSGQSVVQVTVDRFAAGNSAGSSAFLALLDSKSPNGKGLYCFSAKRLAKPSV
jgi:hypothetical protein